MWGPNPPMGCRSNFNFGRRLAEYDVPYSQDCQNQCPNMDIKGLEYSVGMLPFDWGSIEDMGAPPHPESPSAISVIRVGIPAPAARHTRPLINPPLHYDDAAQCVPCPRASTPRASTPYPLKTRAGPTMRVATATRELLPP